MAEKLPSPPLTGIATKIVGESPDVSFEEKVIQKNYEKLVDDLDVQSSVDLFYGRELITSETMEKIDNATTRKGANRILIKDLIKGISPNRFSKFVSLLRESADKYKRPHHKTLADKLEGDLKMTHESEPSPSQLKTIEAKVEANPNPFLPPQFPPTGSPAARGPPSQLLLGPSPGMPLPMPPQVPGAFPPEDRVKDVLKREYSYLRENLSIDNDVASKLFGWSPQLLGDPPYREILSLNERGRHFDAFERWYQFAESSYTEDRLKVFCECLGEVGSPTRPKLIEVGRRVFEMLVGEPMSEDRVKDVLKSEYAYLRENLSIDNDMASKLFGWSPQLLGYPPYREILSLNERGKHFDAFERWYQFAESSYTENRLKVFCECLGEIGSPTRPKLVEVGRRVFKMLVGEPMSDVWMEQYKKAVEKKGSVTLNIIRCVVIGPPNVGKSCLRHLLIHDEPRKVTTSTPMLESPDVVTFEENSSSSDDEDFTPDLCVADVGSSSNWSLITPDDMGQMVKTCSVEEKYDSPASLSFVKMKRTQANGETDLPQASTSLDQAQEVPSPMLCDTNIVPSVSQSVDKTTMLTDLLKANDDLLRDIGAKDGHVHFPLNKLNLIHMFDSGGQLAFQDTLPLLVNTPCTFLTVFNASLDLDEPMDITYRSQDGSEAKLDHKLTQREMMLRTFSSIHAMEYKCHKHIKAVLPEGSSLPPSSIIVVGTHKDVLEKHPKREDIERKIKSSIGLLKACKPYCLSGPKRYFLINALAKHENSNLRNRLSNMKNVLPLKLPLTWLLVELTTRRHKQKFIPYNELKEFCLKAGYISPEDDDKHFLSLLLVLHNLGFYAFYDLNGVSESDNWVCTDAATLYREVSKLLVVQYTEDPIVEATCKFKEFGIIMEETLQELFKELDILPTIDPIWFINVLMHIGIAARLKVEEGERPLFFIPLALPFHRTDLPCTTSVSGLCFTLEFPGKRSPLLQPTVTELPRGIFPRLAVYLCDQHHKEDDMWKIDAKNSDRTHIKFKCKDHAIYLIEHAGYIEVTILLYETFSDERNCASKTHGLCQYLSKTTGETLGHLCEEVFGNQVRIQRGFPCRCKGADTPHLAIVRPNYHASVEFEAECSLKDGKPFKLRHACCKIWFSGDVTTPKLTLSKDGIWIMEGTTVAFEEKSPSDADLQRVLQEIGGYWHEVAISLGVPAQHVTPKDSNPLMAFLYWRNSSSESLLPPTWQCLFEAVCGIAELGPHMVKHLKMSVSQDSKCIK